MKAVVVITHLTHSLLHLGSVRKPINLALLNRVIVGIMYLTWYLTMQIQEI
jgi:hypothetical protein